MLLASADDVSQLVEIGRVLGTIASANAEVMLATPPQQLGLWRSARLGRKLQAPALKLRLASRLSLWLAGGRVLRTNMLKKNRACSESAKSMRP